jgi:hypothetical protein
VLPLVVLASVAALAGARTVALSLASLEGSLIMMASQLGSLALVWLAAGWTGARRVVLKDGAPAPSVAVLLAGGLVLAAATSTLELAMVQFTDWSPADDSVHLRAGISSRYWWATIIIAVVLAPLFEELTFRGFLLSALASTRLGFWGGAAVANVPWTLVHAYSWQGMASVFLAGMILSWLLWRTGSIRAPIAAHAISNAAVLGYAWWVG